ncbi:MAG: sulfurtransferase complex subunit TusD [Idiomarina sp.]
MATISLCIQQSPQLGHSYHALRYARAAIANGHQLQQIFFYQAGVLHALASQHNAQHTADWIAFSHTHQVPLVVCHTVAELYGIHAAVDGGQSNLNPAFDAAGLTEFLVAINQSDKVVQFL